MFSGVFIVDKVDGVGNKRSSSTGVVDVQTFLEALFNMLLRSYFTDEAFFLVKSHPSILGSTPLKCQIIIILSLLDIRLKELCCLCYFSLLLFSKCMCGCSNTLTHYQIKQVNH